MNLVNGMAALKLRVREVKALVLGQQYQQAVHTLEVMDLHVETEA